MGNPDDLSEPLLQPDEDTVVLAHEFVDFSDPESFMQEEMSGVDSAKLTDERGDT